uniref:Uncharacterized protein n=1 Tax=viral metagenome TaxID=1070528 RepID=A0A6M3LR09_9ZZZZ
MTKNVKWIDRSLYDAPFCIGLCLSERAFKAELKKLKVPRETWPEWVSPVHDAHVVTVSQESTRTKLCFVCVDGVSDGEAMLGILVHEATHVWQAICEDMGEDEPSSEFEAYALQKISQGLISAWLSGSKKKK